MKTKLLLWLSLTALPIAFLLAADPNPPAAHVYRLGTAPSNGANLVARLDLAGDGASGGYVVLSFGNRRTAQINWTGNTTTFGTAMVSALNALPNVKSGGVVLTSLDTSTSHHAIYTLTFSGATVAALGGASFSVATSALHNFILYADTLTAGATADARTAAAGAVAVNSVDGTLWVNKQDGPPPLWTVVQLAPTPTPSATAAATPVFHATPTPTSTPTPSATLTPTPTATTSP